ncbi:MAG TPA: UDP-N-acetylglucosamine 2-epimerase (non-hydrolyzing) [Candidatus Kapabacteria bacterium]|nr:UDP-N-acetylglucosamine 2-epimerase (non-hydrolyzing) [Candidatus Kapabacteria bacterium]
MTAITLPPKKILFVVGARPNFMKVAPVLEAVRATGTFATILVHTGQHYDANMSDVFFGDLDMPKPDRFLGVGSGTHAEQTAKVMIEMEKLLAEEQPGLVLVAGDVNSTLATALVAAKAGIPLGHIESGLRSFDRGMPEEINRIVADEFSQYCFVTERSGLKNLEHEGISKDRVFFVGNTMIDSVQKYLPKARSRFPELATKYGLEAKKYALVTLHRPSNVDDSASLSRFMELFERMQAFTSRILFPVHPRTCKRIEEFGFAARISSNPCLALIEPVGYLDFLALQDRAALVLTDSGGIQEETTALGVPCITLRENTERPVTVEDGTNELLGLDMDRVLEYSNRAFSGTWKAHRIPELWDGHAALRIAEILERSL